MNYIKKYEKTFTTNLLEYKTILFVYVGEIFRVEVQFTCPDITIRKIIFSDSGEEYFDFIERSENIIEIELHRIKRNVKINKILKNK